MHNTLTANTLLEMIDASITGGRLSALSRLDILPADSERVRVVFAFRGQGLVASRGLVVVTEVFGCDAEAIVFVLEVFRVLVSRGVARPSEAASWRRDMMVCI
ncbi:hypothetical protein [Halopseudomonas yangmingensis]|uniref:hypothetical protein n=1 Tax=Halopseudomonas yangmingensis TaxID=1720063 RepID=UPI001160BDD1|nr:hypothetical protein [Halopseudomonas yangmingensis]